MNGLVKNNGNVFKYCFHFVNVNFLIFNLSLQIELIYILGLTGFPVGVFPMGGQDNRPLIHILL